MIDNTSKTRVSASPEELWGEFLEPKKLERLIPDIKEVKPIRDGLYLVKIESMGMDFNAKMKEENLKKPELVELKSGDPYFHLKAELTAKGPETEVVIRVRLDPPSFFGMLDDRIEKTLEEKMEENIENMKKEAERG